MTEPLSFKLEYGYQQYCTVCWYEREFMAVGYEGEQPVVNVCGDCIKNASAIDQKLADQIADLRERTEQKICHLESLRGRFSNLPTPEQWRNAVADATWWQITEEDREENEADGQDPEAIIMASREAGRLVEADQRGLRKTQPGE